MTGDVENIVDPTNDPKVPVLVTPCTIAGQIVAFELVPILLLVAVAVTVNCSQHRRPRFANDQFPSDVGPHFFSSFVDNSGVDSEKGKSAATGFGGDCAWQWRDHDRSGLGLPPSVDDWTPIGPDLFSIPHPSLRVNRFTYRSEQSKRRKVMFLDPLVAPADKRSNGCRCRVENANAVRFDNSPEPIRLRPIWRSFVHQGRRAISERTVDHVTMSGDPSDVGCAPIGIIVAEIKDVFRC